MVAPGEQRLAGRRAKSRGVELCVTQPLLRECVHCRHIYTAAEGARRTETDIIEQNYDYVGRTLGRPEWLDRRELGVARIKRNFAGIFVLRIRNWQLCAIDLLSISGNDPRADHQAQCGS